MPMPTLAGIGIAFVIVRDVPRAGAFSCSRQTPADQAPWPADRCCVLALYTVRHQSHHAALRDCRRHSLRARGLWQSGSSVARTRVWRGGTPTAVGAGRGHLGPRRFRRLLDASRLSRTTPVGLSRRAPLLRRPRLAILREVASGQRRAHACCRRASCPRVGLRARRCGQRCAAPNLYGHPRARQPRLGLGPLRSVIVSPRFHRWHHPSEEEARDKNFAGLLPLWDILFGTYYIPRERRPTVFGTTTPVPKGIIGQLTFPFRTHAAINPSTTAPRKQKDDGSPSLAT